jgi:hypothetical protein
MHMSTCRRPSSHKLIPGRSIRGHHQESVTLVAAADQHAESDAVVQQLKAWRAEGYAWDQMAVLCRSKMPVSLSSCGLCCGFYRICDV